MLRSREQGMVRAKGEVRDTWDDMQGEDGLATRGTGRGNARREK